MDPVRKGRTVCHLIICFMRLVVLDALFCLFSFRFIRFVVKGFNLVSVVFPTLRTTFLIIPLGTLVGLDSRVSVRYLVSCSTPGPSWWQVSTPLSSLSPFRSHRPRRPRPLWIVPFTGPWSVLGGGHRLKIRHVRVGSGVLRPFLVGPRRRPCRRS